MPHLPNGNSIFEQELSVTTPWTAPSKFSSKNIPVQYARHCTRQRGGHFLGRLGTKIGGSIKTSRKKDGRTVDMFGPY
jgi:hypothetical protein